MSGWEEREKIKAEAELKAAEANLALATNAELSTAKAKQLTAESESIVERAKIDERNNQRRHESKSLVFRAKMTAARWAAIAKVFGPAVAVHFIWATATVAVTYIVAVMRK